MYKYTLYTVHAIQDRPLKSLGSCPKGKKAAQVGPQIARSNEDSVKTPLDAKVKTESGQPGQPARRKTNQEGLTSAPQKAQTGYHLQANGYASQLINKRQPPHLHYPRLFCHHLLQILHHSLCVLDVERVCCS